jgi:hypothetical protein
MAEMLKPVMEAKKLIQAPMQIEGMEFAQRFTFLDNYM